MSTMRHLIAITEGSVHTDPMLDELREVGAEIDPTGKYIIVYHHTSEDSAKAIRKTGLMTGHENGLFFTTKPGGHASGFGDAVIPMRIPLAKLELDDIFDNEAHLRVPLRRAGEKVDVSRWLVLPETTPAPAPMPAGRKMGR